MNERKRKREKKCQRLYSSLHTLIVQYIRHDNRERAFPIGLPIQYHILFTCQLRKSRVTMGPITQMLMPASRVGREFLVLTNPKYNDRDHRLWRSDKLSTLPIMTFPSFDLGISSLTAPKTKSTKQLFIHQLQ